MESSPRAVLLVIVLIFLFLTPDQQAVRRISQSDNDKRAEWKQRDFDIIGNATYSQPVEGLNLTGFRTSDEHQWQLLSVAQQISREQYKRDWSTADAPVYQRLTGQARGSFQRESVLLDRSKQINLTSLVNHGYFSDAFQRNVTENKGELSISLIDTRNEGFAREIQGTLSIFTDSSPGNGWDADLFGVHFPNGAVVMTTTSRKFHSIPALPFFTLDETSFNASKVVADKFTTRAWKRESVADPADFFKPECELVVWLQPKPLSATPQYTQQIEEELERPDGAPIGQPPPIAFSAVVFSPDCGYILEADPIFGPKEGAYWALVERLTAAFIMIVALQIALLKCQMERCATPSTRSRISYYSIGIAAFGDGLILFAIIGLLMIEVQGFALFAVAAFVSCLHVAFFEVKFIHDIWTVQVGEPANAQRERQRRAAATQPTETLPLPVTARTEGAAAPTVPLTQGSDPPRSSFASLYSRFYFALVNLMFFSLWATSWPVSLRSIYINLLVFLYFSLWIPQIYRNIMRNCRKALTWEYVVGTSVLRAVPVMYWYLDDKNLLAAGTDPRTALLLSSWLGLQILLLVSQQYLGPRLLVKDAWCPPAYDYHPLLHEDTESGGLPIGALASASEGKDKDTKARKVFDCAICMNEIDVPVISKDDTSGRSWLEQRNYMVTPCRHIFHSDCLEGWMNLRLVCPVCREALPPL